jgi:hypothetical protein
VVQHSDRELQSQARAPMSRAVDNAQLTRFSELVTRADWFVRPARPGKLQPGDVTPRSINVPQRDAQAALREVVRLVADLPLGTTPIVVWEREGSELLIDTASIGIACADAVVTISAAVSCDQVPGRTKIGVPFGVGTPNAPAGLVMSTLEALDGPSIITTRWSEALTAFAWESLIELASRLCEQLGRDSGGRPLVPGSIASSRGSLVIQPMSRNDLTALSRMA